MAGKASGAGGMSFDAMIARMDELKEKQQFESVVTAEKNLGHKTVQGAIDKMSQ